MSVRRRLADGPAVRRAGGLAAKALLIWVLAAVVGSIAAQTVYPDLTEGPFDATTRNEFERTDFDGVACYHGQAWQDVSDRLGLATLIMPTVLVLAAGVGVMVAASSAGPRSGRDRSADEPVILPRLALVDLATIVVVVPILIAPAATVRYGWDIATLLDAGCTRTAVPDRVLTILILTLSVVGGVALGHHLERGSRSRRSAVPIDGFDTIDGFDAFDVSGTFNVSDR